MESLRASYSTTVPNVSIRKYFSPWVESYYTNELSVKEILPYSIQPFTPEVTITLVLEYATTTSDLRLNFIKGEKKRLQKSEFISSKLVEYGKDNKTVYLFAVDAKRIHKNLPSQEVQLAFTIEKSGKEIQASIAVWNAYTSVLQTEEKPVNMFVFDNMIQTIIKYEIFEKETN